MLGMAQRDMGARIERSLAMLNDQRDPQADIEFRRPK